MAKSVKVPNMFHLLSLICLMIQLSSGHEAEAVDAAGKHSVHRHRCLLKDQGRHPVPPKLFVFGDSYADTGNVGKSQGSSWNVPYGTTFPGKPAGRFSDGRVLTDFVAQYLGLHTPVAYRWRNVALSKSRAYGINFATGGTGVFDTLSSGPNMSRQIDMLQSLIRKGSDYSSGELNSSVALVSLSGNDYAAYLVKNGSIEGLPEFISRVVNQLVANVQRIHGLGVRRIAVSALGPLGCLPAITARSSFRQCNGTFNALVTFHNQLLQQAVAKLKHHGVNDDDKLSAPSDFIVIDLYSSFSSFLINPKGNMDFENPLKPCCVGTSTEYSCGSVDGKTGEKRYNLCSNPKRAFFWDMYHPTQEGWRAVSDNLRDTLQQLQ